MKINKRQSLKYFLCIIFTIAGLAINKYFIYGLFAILSVPILLGKKCKTDEKALALCILSVILPDNYIPELFFIIYFCLILINQKAKVRRTKYFFVLLCFVFTSITTTLLNYVGFSNVLLSFVSFAPFIAFLILINQEIYTYNFESLRTVDVVLFIETVSVPINYVLRHGIYNDDWSCGTFLGGSGQQAQLFAVASFLAIYYLYKYISNRNKADIWKSFCGLFIMISTNCWTLLVFLLIGIGITYVLNLNTKRILLIMIAIALIPLAFNFAITVLPEHIVSPVIKILSSSEYLEYRVHKLVTYRETFVEIPQRDILFGLFGNGVGNYNSRAALMCTGEYVDFYEDIFTRSISDYTQTYILPYLKLAKDYGETDYGSVIARPYSSIMAMMGETGYIGLFLFTLLIYQLKKRKKIQSKLLIFIWLSFCLIENYFEYSKVLIVLFACIVFSENLDFSNLKIARKERF